MSSRGAALLATVLSALLLAACGQKGPLYLPDQQKQTVKKSIPLPGESKEQKDRNKEEPKAP
jgi:predicted small lipoprotein YifL